MKTRAAILAQMGAAAPYATSKPLEIAEIELAPPGPGEAARAAGRAARGPVVGDRPAGAVVAGLGAAAAVLPGREPEPGHALGRTEAMPRRCRGPSAPSSVRRPSAG